MIMLVYVFSAGGLMLKKTICLCLCNGGYDVDVFIINKNSMMMNRWRLVVYKKKNW